MSAGTTGEAAAIEFGDRSGTPLRVEWRSDALAALAPNSRPEPAWTLRGRLDWEAIEGLRIVSARLGATRLLGVAALRPAGADGHGEELVAGVLGDGERFEQLEEVLLSTEYGADAAVRRIGLELYADGHGLPVRVAGEVTARSSEIERGIRSDSASFELRSAGEIGSGTLDVLRPA